MGRFWKDAMQVLDAASNARGAGGASEMAVVVEASGGLRLVAAAGWSAEGLQSHYGAKAVYHVRHTAEGVCVEGRGSGVSCTLRSRVRAAATVPAGLLS